MPGDAVGVDDLVQPLFPLGPQVGVALIGEPGNLTDPFGDLVFHVRVRQAGRGVGGQPVQQGRELLARVKERFGNFQGVRCYLGSFSGLV